MGFDLASAQPVSAPEGGFDLASAQPVDAPPVTPAQSMTNTAEQPTTLSDIGKNFLSAAMRPVMNAVTAIPELAANTGVALRNISEQAVNRMAPNFAHAIYAANQHLAGDSQVLQALLPQGAPDTSGTFMQSMLSRGKDDYGNGNYGSFSSSYHPLIDQTIRAPEGYGKGAEFVSSAIAGGGVPAPQAAAQAPAAFVRVVTTPKQLTLGASQQAGYVVPPSTTNPTVANTLMESLGGKIATQQDARAINEGVTNSLAAKALGLAEDTPITPEVLKGIRATASEPNQAIRATGTIETDEAFQKGVDAVLAKFKSAGGVSDKLAQTEVKDIAESFNKQFPASDAVDAIQVLRDRASAAYAKGESETGKGLRALSKVLEDQVERHLQTLGKDGADLLAKFRDGRQLMAKTYSVEAALNPATGSVSAAKLAAQLGRGKPLTGELATAAKFGQAFPRVAAPLVDSGSVRNTDVALGGIGAVMQHSTWPLIYPFARLGVRAGLLSEAGQRLAVPGMGGGVPPGLLMGTVPAESSFGQ